MANLLECKYTDNNGNMCVVGKMARDKGIKIPVKDLEETCIDDEHMLGFAVELQTAYNITMEDLLDLQSINDDSELSITEKSEALNNLLKKLNIGFRLNDSGKWESVIKPMKKELVLV